MILYVAAIVAATYEILEPNAVLRPARKKIPNSANAAKTKRV